MKKLQTKLLKNIDYLRLIIEMEAQKKETTSKLWLSLSSIACKACQLLRNSYIKRIKVFLFNHIMNTSVVKTDRTQRGLFSRSQSRFSHTDLLLVFFSSFFFGSVEVARYSFFHTIPNFSIWPFSSLPRFQSI